MSGPLYLDALASERRHNTFLRWVVVGALCTGALGAWIAHQIPKSIDLHIAPDIRAGDSVQVVNGNSPIPPVNVYGFAYYVWQQINRWQGDGAKDYGQQIYNFQSYLTPSCQQQLTADMESRFKNGELRMRTRQISEIPGFAFATNRVLPQGTSSWTVMLDMQVMENYRGQAIKDTFVRYPLRVVRYDVDRERNPWRLAIDCYGTNRPLRLDEAELRAAQANKQAPKVPALPADIEPSTLPSPAPLDVPEGTQIPASPTANASRP